MVSMWMVNLKIVTQRPRSQQLLAQPERVTKLPVLLVYDGSTHDKDPGAFKRLLGIC